MQPSRSAEFGFIRNVSAGVNNSKILKLNLWLLHNKFAYTIRPITLENFCLLDAIDK